MRRKIPLLGFTRFPVRPRFHDPSAFLGASAAWSLLLAYIATGSSVIGGFYHYGKLLLRDATGHAISPAFALLVTAISIWIAWSDVEISARLMLWIEAISVSFILVVVILVLVRCGWHLDCQQLQLRGMTGSGFRLGLVLAFPTVGTPALPTACGGSNTGFYNCPYGLGNVNKTIGSAARFSFLCTSSSETTKTNRPVLTA